MLPAPAEGAGPAVRGGGARLHPCAARHAHAAERRPRCGGTWRSSWRRGCSSPAGGGPEPGYQFRHALLQDAAYQSLPRSTRRQHHRRIAQALVEQFPEVVRDAAGGARPPLHGGGRVRAGHPLLDAGRERASLRSANVEAVSHLQQALKLLRSLPDASAQRREELRLLIALGIPLWRRCRATARPRWSSTYARARELFHQVGEALPQLELSVLGALRLLLRARRVPAGARAGRAARGPGQAPAQPGAARPGLPDDGHRLLHLGADGRGARVRRARAGVLGLRARGAPRPWP